MQIITVNKRARFDYEILETYEAGIELKGFEVKSVKNGRIGIAGSYVVIRNNEAALINADIPAYQPKNTPLGYDSKRTRRLLLHKEEIKSLTGRIQEKGLTLLPLKVYIKKGRVKLEIGLGKSRKKADKRQIIHQREARQKIRSALRGRE
ncbi:MAG: SsrA-binding protein SmpB [Candidatus Brennerbacteria bacterium]|nr:SsrA-binding protein SmpB [Candidatus Brennerbacteria bacterium]